MRNLGRAIILFALIGGVVAGVGRAQGSDPALPDLRIGEFYATILNGDWQSLYVSGDASVEVLNYSYIDIMSDYKIVVFDDIDRNDELNIDTDIVLGEKLVSCCRPWRSEIIAIEISGKIRFRDAILSVIIDQEDKLDEINEQNNYQESDPQCVYEWSPLNKTIDGGKELWRWVGGDKNTPSRRVQTSPLVFDINRDGVSDVIFASHENRDAVTTENGILRVIRGESGEDIFASAQNVNATSSIAIADMDRDGGVEIVAITSKGNPYKAMVFDDMGVVKRNGDYFDELVEWGGASIADINGDGYGEIIVCATAIDHSGKVMWRGSKGRGQVTLGCQSSVADIDMNGELDILAGNTLYNKSGTIIWYKDDIPDGLTAVGNFDNDLLPEIVLVSDGAYVYLLNSDGSTIWGPVDIPGRAGNAKGGGLPTLADFDGDGHIEIGIANNSAYTVFESDGRVKWSQVTSDPGGRSAAAAFDFNADGAYELIYGDEQYIRIYNGKDGSVIWSEKRPAGTSFDMPIIADTDRDNKAEIFTGLSSGFTAPESATRPPGVYSFGGSASAWGWTRAIWNQMSYHVNNIDDTGVVPIFERPSWLDHNTYRAAIIDAYKSGASDITLSHMMINRLDGSSDFEISIRAGNGGGLAVVNGVVLAAFDGDPARGGRLIGMTTTRERIRYNQYIDIPGDGDTRIVWKSPSPGEHEVYVVADYGDILTECRINNNTHSMKINIGEETPEASVTGTTTRIAQATTTPVKESTPTKPASVTPSVTSKAGDSVRKRSYVPFVWRTRR